MRECSNCQAVNDDKAQFCLECGQKLAPPGRQQAFADEQKTASPSGGKQRLHSPILGGYEDVDDSPRRPQEKARPSSPKGAKPAHLRSPLLGGGDEDEEYEEPQMKPGKAKLPGKSGGRMRSPLLGGAAGGLDQDDYEEDFPLRDRNDDRSPFPHRSRPREVDHDASPQQTQPSPPQGSKAHLRSPLLGGGDEEFEEEPYQQNAPRNAGGASRPQKLHSPIFDRSGGSSGGFDDYDDDDGGEIDDPSVLRSPLLAAKSRVPLDRSPKQPQPGQVPNQAVNKPQPSYNQMPPGAPQGYPQAGNAPAYPSNLQAQPQQAYPSQPPQPAYQQPGPPLPQAPSTMPPQPAAGNPAQPIFNSPPLNPPSQPGLTPSSFGAPSQNAFQSPPATPDSLSNQSYEFSAPGAGAGQSSLFLNPGAPSPQSQPAAEPKRPLLPADIGPSTASSGNPSTVSLPSSVSDAKTHRDMSSTIQETAIDPTLIEQSMPAPPAPKSKSLKSGGRFGTAMLEPSDDFDEEPKTPVGRKGSGLVSESSRRRFEAASPSSDDHYAPAAPHGAVASGPIMVIFIPAFLAGIGKLWYIVSFMPSFMQNPPMLVDQLGSVAIIVGLIIFSMKGAQK